MYIAQCNYIYATRIETLVKNLEGLLEQNVHVMLPSKAFQFWTVLLECIYLNERSIRVIY